MKHFNQLTDLPTLNLYHELETLLNNKTISWYNNGLPEQICINTVNNDPSNIYLGRGSLIWDWDNSYTDENGEFHLKKRETIFDEKDFDTLCTQFIETGFEQAYRALEKKFILGRVRIMNLAPKTCLTWHNDSSTRIHYPMKTQEGCYMVIQDEIKHLPQNTWWHTDTLVNHTVFNGSKENRFHLVAAILGEK